MRGASEALAERKGWTGGELSQCLQQHNYSRSRRVPSRPAHTWPRCKLGTLKQRLLQLDQPLNRQKSIRAL